MALKSAQFSPTIIALDQVPPVEYSKLFNITESLHQHSELHDVNNPFLNIRGGQQIQIYPNIHNIDNIEWITNWISKLCQEYMDLVTEQTGVDDLKYCKPEICKIWTIRQTAGDYQILHSHLGSNISGNIYITTPDDLYGTDGQISFRLPYTRDISRLIMTDSWSITPEPATFMIFPSHIPHTVYPWKCSGVRTVISFEAQIIPIDTNI